MTGLLFPSSDTNVLVGSLDNYWFEAQFNEISGMYELEAATNLEQSLNAACKIMKARMLGFIVMSEHCRQDLEFYQSMF